MKLYTLHGIKFYDDDKITAKPATPAEIAEAHPNCRTCGLMRKGPHITSEPYCLYRAAVDPDLDYCRHHSQLTKETT